MVVERESVMGGDSDSLDKKFIIVQAKQTDGGGCGGGGPEETGYYSSVRRLNTTGYYRLDLHTDDVSVLPRTVQDQGSMSSMVALGSKIYIFGRQINNSDSKIPCSSYFLDLTDSQKSSSSSSSCWKRAHPLTTDRLPLPLGGAVAFAGKMYFFRNSDDFSCFCEVFDPAESEPQWSRIKSTPTPTPGGAKINPTFGTPVASPVLADHKNNRIIVFLSNISSMYAYYPFEDRWECLVECFLVEGIRRWFSYLEPVTIVGGVIYLHRPKLSCFFMAFDIATQEWLNVRVSPDAVKDYKFYLPIRIYASLLHLGNDILCLLASRYKNRESNQSQTTLVHVVQFKLKLINNNGEKEVIVTPLSSRYYDLDSRCALYRCLAL